MIHILKLLLKRLCAWFASRSRMNALFFKNRSLTIDDLYSFKLGRFMFDDTDNSLPSAFDRKFSYKNQSFHNYLTRQSNEFHLQTPRISFTNHSNQSILIPEMKKYRYLYNMSSRMTFFFKHLGTHFLTILTRIFSY